MKIIAVLLNPTIDQIFEIEDFYIGGTFKVKNSVIYPVGKAISNAIGIRELSNDLELKVIAFIGKEEISLYSKFLTEKGIEFEFIEIKGKTRSNKTVNDPIKNTTTHIREKGFSVEKKALQKLVNLLEIEVNTRDFVIFSGSIPPNVEDNVYYELINKCKNKSALTILDTNGNALIKGLKANPMVIKPNLVELSQVLNNPKLNKLNFSNLIESCKIIVDNTKILLNDELEIVLITLGKNGAILLTKSIAIHGIIHVNKVVDTVGSGDSFLAGFILKLFFKSDLKDCFKCALACGAANTLIPGPGIFKKEDVKELLRKVEIKDLN